MKPPQGLLPFMDILTGLVGVLILVNIILALSVSESEEVTVEPVSRERTPHNLKPVFVICDASGIEISGQMYTAPHTDAQKERVKSAIRFALSSAGSDSYVLAFVRPNGYDTFHALKPVVQSLKVRIGYEPLNSNWKLTR